MKYLKIILPLILITTSALSQSLLMGLSWSMGFGTGKTSDYIGSPSFTGFSLQANQFIKPNVSIGFTTGWNILNERNNEAVTVGNTTISGEQGRYLNVVPVLLNAGYYIKSNNKAKFVPFIKANVGVYYILQRFDIGVFTVNNYNWHLGVAPELGFMIQASKTINVLTSAKYNYAFDSGTRLNGNENNDHSFFSLNFGISYFK